MDNGWKFNIVAPDQVRLPARAVSRVFLHCTASDNPTLEGVMLVQEVNRWHLQKQWAGVGYHFLVDKRGQVMSGRDIEREGAAQLGPDKRGNIGAIAICTHGNWDFPEEGLKATRELCAAINDLANNSGRPVTFHGHKEIDPKPCPVYNYKSLLGLDEVGRFGAGRFEVPAIVSQLAVHADAPRMMGSAPAAVVMLQKGDASPAVAALQKVLGVPATGIFDDRTQESVMAFQDGAHLIVDGKVGPNTRAALGI